MSVYRKDKSLFFKQALDSLINQGYKKFVINIIFDGPVSKEIESYIEQLNDDRIILKKDRII